MLPTSFLLLLAFGLGSVATLSAQPQDRAPVPKPPRAKRADVPNKSAPAEVIRAFEAQVAKDNAGHELPYRLFRPKTASGRAYPLVVFLHGSGESGTNNEAQLATSGAGEFADPATQAVHPCFVVAPQCPRGGQWGYHRGEVWPAEAMIALVRKLMVELPIDADRVYLTGLSLGGMGTWYAIAAHPELFAAAIPVAAAGDPTQAGRIRNIPVWAFHGTNDRAVPISGPVTWNQEQIAGDRDMIAALEKAGATPKFTVYEGAAHRIWDRVYHDPELMAWLFAQRRPVTKSAL